MSRKSEDPGEAGKPSSERQTFDAAMKRIVSVSKDELSKRESEYQDQRKRKRQ